MPGARASVLPGGLRDLGLISLGKRWLQGELTAAYSASGKDVKGTHPGSGW